MQTEEGRNANAHKIAALSHRVISLEAEVQGFKSKIAVMPEDLERTQKGVAAQFYVKYLLTRLGFIIYDPPEGSKGLDLLVEKGGKFYRCEIKGTTKPDVNVQKSSRKSDTGVAKYTAEDNIDFFFLVDLTREYVFVVPSRYITDAGKSVMRLSPNSDVWQFRDRFDLIGV